MSIRTQLEFRLYATRFHPHRMPSLLGPLATQRRQSARFLASNRRAEPPNDGPPPALSSSPHHSGMSTVRFTLQRLTHSTSRPPTLCRVDDSTHALSRMTTAFTLQMPSRCNTLGPQRQPAHSLASNRRTAFWPLRRLTAINSPLHHLRSYACRCTHHIIRRSKLPTQLGCSTPPVRDRARVHRYVTFHAWSVEASPTSRATRAGYSSGARITARTCTAPVSCLCAS